MAKKVCSVEGCGGVHVARGWCGRHYEMWRLTGDPIARVRPYYGEGRRVMDGYVLVRDPGHPLALAGGYVAEHRKVAWDAGLFDDPSWEVHHDNEDRSDNRLCNLVPMPSGAHLREHHRRRGVVVNQYGVWPLKAGVVT